MPTVETSAKVNNPTSNGASATEQALRFSVQSMSNCIFFYLICGSNSSNSGGEENSLNMISSPSHNYNSVRQGNAASDTLYPRLL